MFKTIENRKKNANDGENARSQRSQRQIQETTPRRRYSRQTEMEEWKQSFSWCDKKKKWKVEERKNGEKKTGEKYVNSYDTSLSLYVYNYIEL